jgi:divalent metal cation (Fe/Co/Zn/Cd) transporter
MKPMTTDNDLGHYTDAQLLHITRLMARVMLLSVLATLVSLVCSIWVDWRWLLMALIAGVICTVTSITSSAALGELRKRYPDMKWGRTNG